MRIRSIKSRLMLGFGAVTGLSVIVAGFVYAGAFVTGRSDDAREAALVRVNAATRTVADVHRSRLLINEYVHFGSAPTRQAALDALAGMTRGSSTGSDADLRGHAEAAVDAIIGRFGALMAMDDAFAALPNPSIGLGDIASRSSQTEFMQASNALSAAAARAQMAASRLSRTEDENAKVHVSVELAKIQRALDDFANLPDLPPRALRLITSMRDNASVARERVWGFSDAVTQRNLSVGRFLAVLDRIAADAETEKAAADQHLVAAARTAAAVSAGMQRGILLATLATVLLGVLIAWRMGRSLTSPVLALDRSMRAIAGGALDISVPGDDRPDEIGTMARTVTYFRDRLREAEQLRRNEREAEEKLKLYRAQQLAEVEQQVRERTEELEVARQVADEANQAKGNFLARMSHEIRTPMNAVIGMTQLALRTDLSAKQRDYMTKSMNAAQALLGIINDILDFSKIEAGKMTLEHIPFDLEEVFDNISNIITMKAEEKGVEILFSLDRHLPNRLVGDPLRLGQVLINLANNAVKFTEKGEVIISARLGMREEGRCRVQLSIRDTGIGMTQEQVASLFQSFHQADNSITRKYGGTGLGLAISKQLVEMMDGTLKVESRHGIGTTFMFELPFEIAQTLPTRRTLDIQGLLSQPVLVVDDNSTARQVMRDMLESFSCEVETANDGIEAVAILRQRVRDTSRKPFGLVLMDWNMPGLNGVEATKLIKSDQGTAAMPAILMVTAYGREEIMKAAQNAGADGFLVKPVNASTLYNTIVEVLATGDEPGHDRIRTPQRMKPACFKAGSRILLVEDNPINQQVATEILEQAGLGVDVASRGRQAIDAVLASRYDLVLMDIQMPDMDGLEATRRIRALAAEHPELATLPIVAMTAHAMAGDRENSLAAGMNDHLTKPINLDELDKVLNRWLVGDDYTDILPSPAPQASANDQLPAIHDVDTLTGLRQVGGGRALYLRLLGEFADQYEDAGQELATLIAAGQHADAERLAHSIKGAAGTLGIIAPASHGAKIEAALRNGAMEAGLALVPAMTEALHAFAQAMRADTGNRNTPSPEAVAAKGNIEAAAALMVRLEGLLQQRDSASERLLPDLRAALAGQGFDDLLGRLTEAVEDVEFTTALALTGTIRQALETRTDRHHARTA